MQSIRENFGHKVKIGLIAILLGLIFMVLFIMAKAPPCVFGASPCPVGSNIQAAGTMSFQNSTAFAITYTGTPTNNRTVTWADADLDLSNLTSTLQGQVTYFSAAGVLNHLATGTSGQLLQTKGASANPAWTTATFPATATGTGTILRADGTNWVATTATYPATTTVNQILYSSSTNVIGEITTGNNGVVITSGAGVPSISSTLPSAVQGNITALGAVTSGSINSVIIGGSSAAAGTFTTLTGSSTFTLNQATGMVVNPGSDTNATIFTAQVTGTPLWKWVEASDFWSTNKPIDVAATTGSRPNSQVYAGVFQSRDNATTGTFVDYGSGSTNASAKIISYFAMTSDTGGDLGLDSRLTWSKPINTDATARTQYAIQTIDAGATKTDQFVFSGTNFGLGTSTFDASIKNGITMFNGTAGAGGVTNATQLYTVSGELKVKDASGNETVLSPHNASVLDAAPSTEWLPWTYSSCNAYVGRCIDVDMEALVRAMEKLTGETFLVTSVVPARSWCDDQTAQVSKRNNEITKAQNDKLTNPKVKVPDTLTVQQPPKYLQDRGVATCK